ncbi:hypothetical protein FACS1894202_11530 [Clostridia bacterium]|nr:hypothetical protein FACS1894202_11530 [Clostridia bacterium]
MSIKKTILVASALLILVCAIAQTAVFFTAKSRMVKQAEVISDELTKQADKRSEDEIKSLADTLTAYLTDTENDIDDSMYNAAVLLQELDTLTEVGDAELRALADKLRINDLYLADMDGNFTVSTVPGAVGGIGLFDIWDGYRMLVTGESTELPSAIKIMVETGDIYKFTALPRYDAEGNIKGALEAAFNVGEIDGRISDIISGYSMINALHLFEPTGLVLMSSEKSAAKTHFSKGTQATLSDISAAVSAGSLLNAGNDDGTITYYTTINRFGGPAYVLRVELDASYYDEISAPALQSIDDFAWEARGRLLHIALIGGAFMIALSVSYILLVSVLILKPIGVLRVYTARVSLGDTSPIDVSGKRNELGALERDFASMVASINEQARLLDKIAQGDYTVSVPVRSDKDIMSIAINSMVSGSSSVISDIRASASEVADSSQQVAGASQVLAQGASEQAGTLEKCTDAITRIQSMARENVKTADGAVQQMKESGRVIAECSSAMEQMLKAMRSIDTSSHDIANVIKTIDDIAFQTNILALNASVEAARAGQHGKGFAVVAEEVRNLAAKSAEAAKNTARLITESSESVKEGNTIVARVNESLQAIVAISELSASSIEQLRTSSAEQSESMAGVADSVISLGAVVQANTATAEETAASSAQMSEQSTVLDSIVSHFQLS